MFRVYHENKGFTLIELMVTIAVSSIVMAAVYFAYDAQARSYNTQQLTIDMQENLRVAMDMLQMDLRMTGSDPSGTADAGFQAADAVSVQMTMDITGGENDGEDNNDNYLVDEGSNGLDDDGDGFVDEFDEEEWYDGDAVDADENVSWALSGTTLQRTTTRWDDGTAAWVVNTINVAFNIEQLDLVYLDSNGTVIDDDGAGSVDAANLDQIKAVQITIIGNVGNVTSPMTFRHTDQNQYTNQRGTVILDMTAAPDTTRRRMVSTEINCRNS